MDRYLAIAHRIMPSAGADWPLSEFGRIFAVNHAAEVIRAELEIMLGEIRAELDEADRAAGEALRKLDRAEELDRARSAWFDKAKRDAGAHHNTSFDFVWAAALAALKAQKETVA